MKVWSQAPQMNSEKIKQILESVAPFELTILGSENVAKMIEKASSGDKEEIIFTSEAGDSFNYQAITTYIGSILKLIMLSSDKKNTLPSKADLLAFIEKTMQPDHEIIGADKVNEVVDLVLNQPENE